MESRLDGFVRLPEPGDPAVEVAAVVRQSLTLAAVAAGVGLQIEPSTVTKTVTIRRKSRNAQGKLCGTLDVTYHR